MLTFTTNTDDDAPVEREREELFSLNGVVYTIPTKAHPSEMHAYLFTRRNEGADAAVSFAWQSFVDYGGYAALVNAGPVVSEEDWERLTAVILGRLVGRDVTVPGPKAEAPLEEPAPESAPASKPAPRRSTRRPTRNS